MGKPELPDRLAQVLVALVALFSLGNGAFMLVDPFGWYQAVETVKFTGPPNQHFIRDIGLAYLTCGAILAFAVPNLAMRWLAAFAGSLWLAIHGFLHIWEFMTGVCAPGIFWQDAPGVLGPPLLVWAALGILFAQQKVSPAGIPDSLVLGAVEKMSPGESEYFREIAGTPGHALEKFKHFMPVTMHRFEAPADLFHMARIAATLVEDCGPCALVAAEGAVRDGVDSELVNAALKAEPPEGDLKTAFIFGAAIARQSIEAFTIGDTIEEVYGRTVRLELAMTAATVRAYPAIKRGLGLSKACSLTPLSVG
ncbi:hypothetical protein [Aquisediminimonas profunda]|uniref:hypothetical protein n=1 Tax=Aquisediminimonas profunda TaxID=1550733 RepID=UPI001C639F4E|nr:hypothetical protein [Aquisediminimonas profunda]